MLFLLPICLIIAVIFIYICILISGLILKHKEKNKYELKTYSSTKNFIVVTYLLLTIGIAPFIISMILLKKGNTGTYFFMANAVGIIISTYLLIKIYSYIIQFEAIKETKIYYRHFIKTKEIDIKDIRAMNKTNKSHIISATNARSLSISNSTIGVVQLFNLVFERTNGTIYNYTSVLKTDDSNEAEKKKRNIYNAREIF